MSEYHKPVLLDESITALITNTSGYYADATFGGGGHSAEILRRLSREGRLISFDRDEDALGNAIDDKRFSLVRNNFRFIHNYALLERSNTEGRFEGFDGILADLGVSSHQFDTAERGFSFRFEAPLDMRMNNAADKTAADVVNGYEENELDRIFSLYGEIPNSGKLAKLIVSGRQQHRLETTRDLNEALSPVLPSFAEHKFLAKVYQALRIEVNEEMRSLEKFLEGASASLKKGGRLVIITYHSLEDRMVKNFIKSGNIEGKITTDMFGNRNIPLKAVNKKPILPDEDEISANTRARSAKLRIAEKVI